MIADPKRSGTPVPDASEASVVGAPEAVETLEPDLLGGVWWTRLEEYLALTLMGALTVIVCVGVISRLALASPTSWTEPLARYLLIWSVCIGAAVGVKRQVQMSVSLPTARWSPRAVAAFDVVTLGIQTLVLGALFWMGLGLAMSNGSPTSIPGVSWHHVYAALPVGAGLALLHSLRHLASASRRAVR